MKSKKYTKNNKKSSVNKLKINKTKWNTSEKVFGRAKKTAVFKSVYNEERLRLALAKRIRDIRIRKGLTQKMVAKRAYITQSVVARLEKGENSMSVYTLGRVVNALDKKILIN